jgi:signal transduction histidine kinase
VAVARPPSRAWILAFVVPGLVLAYALAASVAVPRAATPLTTYAGGSSVAHAADLAAGLALLGAGLLAWTEQPTRRLALLAIAAGVVWFAPDWDGWERGPALVRSLGALSMPLFAALLFHLVVAAPSGRLQSSFTRGAVAGAYLLAAGVSVGRALFRDPFLDPYCWRNCIDNSFLANPDPGLARTLDVVWLLAALALGLLVVAISARRLHASTASGRRVLLPVLVPGIVAGAAEAAYALALLRTPLEDPSSDPFSWIFLARALSIALLGLGVAWSVLRARRTRVAVSRLAAELGDAPTPGTLSATLAAGVGDPALQVAYWLPDSQRFVDGEGNPTDAPVAGRGRAATPIVREGRPVAVVVHDAALLDGPGIEREIGSAARLAVENERLQAELLAQLAGLRASRARIVGTGDAERRRLERDLHDGAQQRLLALSYDLRLARASAEADGDPELVEVLASAAEDADAALDELRELAQGIYPAILAEAGIGPALATLADRAALPVELGEVTTSRHSTAVETTAYVTVAEAIDEAAGRGATFVSVAVVREGESLMITVRDDGARRSSQLVHLADRVGALGGSLDLGPTTLRAEIRCE